MLDKVAKALPPICEEQRFDGSALCQDYLVSLKLDVEVLDVLHAHRHGSGDRCGVYKIPHFNEHVIDEQGMPRGKIEIGMRYIVGKGRSRYANGVDAIGPPRGATSAK